MRYSNVRICDLSVSQTRILLSKLSKFSLIGGLLYKDGKLFTSHSYQVVLGKGLASYVTSSRIKDYLIRRVFDTTNLNRLDDELEFNITRAGRRGQYYRVRKGVKGILFDRCFLNYDDALKYLRDIESGVIVIPGSSRCFVY